MHADFNSRVLNTWQLYHWFSLLCHRLNKKAMTLHNLTYALKFCLGPSDIRELQWNSCLPRLGAATRLWQWSLILKSKCPKFYENQCHALDQTCTCWKTWAALCARLEGPKARRAKTLLVFPWTSWAATPKAWPARQRCDVAMTVMKRNDAVNISCQSLLPDEGSRANMLICGDNYDHRFAHLPSAWMVMERYTNM